MGYVMRSKWSGRQDDGKMKKKEETCFSFVNLQWAELTLYLFDLSSFFIPNQLIGLFGDEEREDDDEDEIMFWFWLLVS